MRALSEGPEGEYFVRNCQRRQIPLNVSFRTSHNFSLESLNLKYGTQESQHFHKNLFTEKSKIQSCKSKRYAGNWGYT